jgi:hypothetical protein
MESSLLAGYLSISICIININTQEKTIIQISVENLKSVSDMGLDGVRGRGRLSPLEFVDL